MDEPKAKLGRKPSSQIRNNIIELLFFLKSAYGYDLHKKYKKVFGPVSMRSVYYHLNKGVELGVFNIKEIQEVQGDYSWGTGVRRIVFGLGKNAKPLGLQQVYDRLKQLHEQQRR